MSIHADMPFTTFLDQCFMPWAEKQKTTKTDQHIYRAMRQYFADRPLSAIDRRSVVEFRAQRAATPTQWGRARGNRTINREISILSAVFSYALELELIERNPCRELTSLPFRAPRPRYWTPEQFMRAVPYMANERAHLYSMCYVAVCTGLARKDLFQLTVGQCQLLGPAMVCRERAKTGQLIDVPANRLIEPILRDLCAGKNPEDYVFINPRTGDHYRDCKHGLQTLARLAGNPEIGFHGFRHSFCTWLAQAGVNIERIAELAAHSNIQTTRLYIHLAANALRPEVEKLADILVSIGPHITVEEKKGPFAKRPQVSIIEFLKAGGPEEDRTPDLRIAKAGACFPHLSSSVLTCHRKSLTSEPFRQLKPFLRRHKSHEINLSILSQPLKKWLKSGSNSC